jgi:orotate phosphoribosyltransferase
MDACAKYIQENYADEMPDMLLGVANGANRMSISIASRLSGMIYGLTTNKLTPKSVELTKVSDDFIASYKPKYVLILEDVGTAGTASATAALAALKAGAGKVTVLNTWQRREHLEKLEEAGVEYDSMIKEFMPTYEPVDCELCKNNVKLIPHE